MNCILCQGEIVYQSDDFKHLTYSRTGHTQISRTNYTCRRCLKFLITVDHPGEELNYFIIELGSGYTIKGTRDDVIQITCKDNSKSVTLPWNHLAGFKNIISNLQELSQKYEIYVTFS